MPPDKPTPTRPHRRHFIAGAVCPQCQAVDRLVVESDDAGESQYCVSCGFRSVANAENLADDKNDVQMVHIQPAGEPGDSVKSPKKVS